MGGLNLSKTGDETDINLEPCSKGKRVCIAPPDDSKVNFLYIYTLVIQDLGVLIHFTVFESEILNTINVAHNQIHLMNGHSSGCSKSCVGTWRLPL